LDPARAGGLEGYQGLGVLLQGEGGGRTPCHPGINSPGATCWLEGCPESGEGAVILANGMKGLQFTFEILAVIH
jgi:hypothetical protein